MLPDGACFRQAVSDCRNPDDEGFNKYNSLRIDAFYNALDAVGSKEKATALEGALKTDASPAVALDESKLPSDAKLPAEYLSLLDTVQCLTVGDVQYLTKEATAMHAKMRRHLSPTMLEFLMVQVNLAHGMPELDALLKRLEELNG